MSQTDLRTHKRKLLIALLVLIVGAPTAAAQSSGPPSPGPPWGQFLPQGTPNQFLGDLFVDPLLKKPFQMLPDDTPTGLAAKLKAAELDIPNKIKGIRYLATFHCAKFPEAREMLLQVLLNDEWEPVRLEAATGLRDMFLNCGCNAESDEQCECEVVSQIHADLDSKVKHVHAVMDEKVKALLKGDVCAVLDPNWIHPLFQYKLHMDRLRGAPDADSSCQCNCCCNAETLNKLAKVAYESKDDGCCFEPSRRVREMAVEAIAVCGVPCHYKPYVEGDEYGPPAYDPEPVDGEVLPPVVPSEGEQLPDVGSRTLNLPRSANYTPVPNSRLKKVCLVSLKQGEKVLPTGEFSRAYRGRTYQFASEAAMIEFEQSPEEYAVAFGGCDPVHFVATRKVVEGRYLIVHGGRFYMFATKQNLALFKAEPGRYTMKHEGDRRTSTENSTLTSAKINL